MIEASDQNLSPFGEPFQYAIIGYCLNDVHFLQLCRSLVEPNWFTKQTCSEVTKIIYDIFDTKKSEGEKIAIPTKAEIFTDLAVKYPKQQDKVERQQVVERAFEAIKHYSASYVKSEMTGWIKMIRMNQLIFEGAQLFKKREFKKCDSFVTNKTKEINNTSFMGDQSTSFDDLSSFMKSHLEELDGNCITFGNVHMDQIFRKELKNKRMPTDEEIKVARFNRGELPDWYYPMDLLTDGGFKPKQTTCIIGSTNSGKTTSILTIIARNIMMGKHILFINHEEDADDIKLKLMACMLGIPISQISQSYQNEPIKGYLVKLENMLREQLKYINWNDPYKMYVEDVMDLIESEQEKKISQRGKGFDLLVDDYPGTLESKHLGGKATLWGKQKYIYHRFTLMAQKHRFHAIVPAQTNRNGSKVNKGDTDDLRMVAMEDIAEGWGITNVVHNIITINRSDWDKAHGTIRFYVAKSRSSDTDYVLICKTNMAIYNAFGSQAGTMILSPGDKADTLRIMQQLDIRPTASDPPEVRNALLKNHSLEKADAVRAEELASQKPIMAELQKKAERGELPNQAENGGIIEVEDKF